MSKSKPQEEDIFDTKNIVVDDIEEDEEEDEEEEEEEEEELEELEQLENDINGEDNGEEDEDDEDEEEDEDDEDDEDEDAEEDEDEDDEDEEVEEEKEEGEEDEEDDDDEEEDDGDDEVDGVDAEVEKSDDKKSGVGKDTPKSLKENQSIEDLKHSHTNGAYITGDKSESDTKDLNHSQTENVNGVFITKKDATVSENTNADTNDQSSNKEGLAGKGSSNTINTIETNYEASQSVTDTSKMINTEADETIKKEKINQEINEESSKNSDTQILKSNTSPSSATEDSANIVKDQESTSTSVEPEPISSKVSSPEEQMRQLVHRYRTHASLATQYNIVPQVAIPYSSAIHSLAFSQHGRFLYTGGEDGFIRKYDTFQSIDGETQLTAAQRHSVVDSVTNAGTLLSYWENEIPFKKSSLGTSKRDHYEMKLSPVYALAAQSQGMWLLSGLSNGGVNLQSLRHMEGQIVHHWRQHTSVISDLILNDDETKFISGGWDMRVNYYDLNKGNVISSYENLPGQVIALEYRPSGSNIIDVTDIKQPISKEEDDDMDSLFGDDDDDDNEPAPKKQSSSPKGQEEESIYSPSTFTTDSNVFLSTATNGNLTLLDHRQSVPCLTFKPPKSTAPFALSSSWSTSGDSIFVGRRNAHVEEISLRMPFDTHTGETITQRNLKFPSVSGAVTVVKTMPNSQHVVCGSYDNIRIYDLKKYETADSRTPFWIIPGHHGGVLSRLLFDPSWRYCVSASGGRGIVQGQSTEMCFFYEVDCEQ